MSSVSVREFAYNPSAIFARVEHGETVEVTKHGRVIAMLVPPPRVGSRYDELVARGAIRPADRERTTQDLDKYTQISVPDGVEPLAVLLELRKDER